ncbi:hypothetical protein FB566_0899 [Stackebrandtia endophytica]|uniref:Uncharacterized protein n=1 Tax=Stackebrandtia endophytica TaxID=1496996 RepID=A0A543AS40_9ACTN|nr:hypothetical protein FB566_0899 [Stackebrandtia endophytica]
MEAVHALIRRLDAPVLVDLAGLNPGGAAL